LCSIHTRLHNEQVVAAAAVNGVFGFGWGYTVLLWDLSDVLDDTLTCTHMKQVCLFGYSTAGVRVLRV
jgi:hypothetical protein